MTTRIQRVLLKKLFTVFFLIPLLVAIEVPVFFAGAGLAAYLYYSKDLPAIPELASYQPRTVSTFFADDGTIIGVFYRQKRFVLDLEEIPQHVVNAFLAAEDARFYEHGGVDWQGLARALVQFVKERRITGGGSTITMQVTRAFILSKERRFSRKFKEILLAGRLEKVWGKKKILHVYLNEIYLGEGAYGVEAAARGYFDKPVQQLSVAEAALIAGLNASPNNYSPFKDEARARQRQLYVLGRMWKVGFIGKEEYEKAKNEPLRFKREVVRPFDLVPDFAEAVRRYIIAKYGEEKLYNEGLQVFTTCRVDYQKAAIEALEKGIEEIKTRQKHHFAVLRTVAAKDIPNLLAEREPPKLQEGKIYQGVVTKVRTAKNKDTEIDVALSQNLVGRVRIEAGRPGYKVGDVLALRFERFVDDVPLFVPDSAPKLQGALVCIENKTGYVRALVGGVSGEPHQFNRAIQGRRQPGSAFKPIIYATAIERMSYSPGTVIVDEPITVEVEGKNEDWEPKNASGDFLGPLSLRRALELSRNICTIKILMDVGFDPVIELARKMGISSPLGRNLSLSLGTSEVSLFELTSAYTVFPNSGIYVEPVLVRRVEDRFGNVLEDNSRVPVLDESEIPTPIPRKDLVEMSGDEMGPAESDDEDTRSGPSSHVGPRQMSYKTGQTVPASNSSGQKSSDTKASRVRAAMSPATAYIMTKLMQGAVGQGTAASMKDYLKRKDLAGKTGTTNRAEDTWFIGFNPDFTTGVWVGFDEKRPLGKKEAGGRAALPIWGYFMQHVLHNRPVKDFVAPPDVVNVEMVTYTGNIREGYYPTRVVEPVYQPFAGRTLLLCPIDTPETLAEYLGTVQTPSVSYPAGPGPLPPGILPVQPGAPIPLYPIAPGTAVQPPPSQQPVSPGFSAGQSGPPYFQQQRAPYPPHPRQSPPLQQQPGVPPRLDSRDRAPAFPNPYYHQQPQLGQW